MNTKKVSFHVQKRGIFFRTDEGNRQGEISSETLNRHCAPPDDYTVTYSLAPRTGKFDVRLAGFVRVGPINIEEDWQVCQIPYWWVGKRVSRHVVETPKRKEIKHGMDRK